MKRLGLCAVSLPQLDLPSCAMWRVSSLGQVLNCLMRILCSLGHYRNLCKANAHIHFQFKGGGLEGVLQS